MFYSPAPMDTLRAAVGRAARVDLDAAAAP